MTNLIGAVYLDAKNRPIREREIYVGTLNAKTVSTRNISKTAWRASSF